MRYVLDCNLVADWFSPGELSPGVDRAIRLVRSREIQAHAPELLLTEFAHFLTKRLRRRQMNREMVVDVWEDFRRLPIEFHAIGPLAGSAFELAIENHATAYDAAYVALAISIDARVLTSDAGMQKSFADTGRAQHVDDLKP